MIKNIITLLLVACAGYLYAQVPGYMGLKFSVKYDAGLMEPILVGRAGVLPMLYHNASVDYVVSRYVSVGVKYGFMTYNAPPDAKEFVSGVDYSANNYKGRYTQHTAAFIVKRYFSRAGFIAPVGRYLTFGVYYQYANVHEATTYANGDYLANAGASPSPPTGFKGTASYGGFILGCGRSFVEANRLLIDFGFNLNVPMGIPDFTYAEKTTVYREIALRNLLQIYLGLGVLAF